MDEKKVKPVNAPQGWQLKKEFIDETGQKFSRGRFVEKVAAAPKVNVRVEDKDAIITGLPIEAPVASEVLKAPEPVKGPAGPEAPVSMEEFINTLPADLIAKLQAKFSAESQAETKKMLDDFKKSFEVKTSSGFNVDDLAEAMVRAQQFQVKGAYYRNVKDIDPNDYDPNGCVFTAYGTGYIIVDDKRGGQPVRTPYGRFFLFKHSYGRVTKIGPHNETYSALCTFGTNSKKEIQWLKEHSKFGIEFFLDSREALSANAFAAQIAAKVNTEVRALTQSEILRRAQHHGVTLGGDLEGVIRKLVLKVSDEKVAQINKETQSRFRDATLNSEFGGPESK